MKELPWKFLDPYRGKRFAGEWPTLPELFLISAERYPDRPCFTTYDPDRVSLTYREALARIGRAASVLREQGIGKGDQVAVTGKNSPEWAIAYLAVLFAGAAVVPLDSQLSREDTEILLRASGASVVFSDEEKYDDLDPDRLGLRARYSLSSSRDGYILALGGGTPETGKPGSPEESFPDAGPAAENDLAAILFTSGTTGVPKGVMLTHRNLVSDCFLAQANLSVRHTDVFYALLPIHHAYTMLAVFIESLSVGAETVFGKRMATGPILRDLRQAKVTMFLGVPMLFNKLLAGILRGVREKGPAAYALVRSLMALSGLIKKTTGINPGKRLFRTVLEKASLSTIRICISGGGPLAPEVFRRYNELGIDFVQGYGLTETSPIITLNPVEHYKETSVGRVIPEVRVRILDPDERGAGEIAVRGPIVMRGYYRNEEETGKVLSGDGWLRTGDVGYLDDENYLYLTGRAKSMIVTEGGKNVYPEEIENRFQLYDEIDQILIRGYEMDRRTRSEGIEAVVFPDYDYFSTLEQRTGERWDRARIEQRVDGILAEVNLRMQPYQRISRTTVLERPMEMTTTRKIKRHAVQE